MYYVFGCFTPHEDIETQIPPCRAVSGFKNPHWYGVSVTDWQTLHEEVSRESPDQEAKVEDGAKPVVIGAGQVQIFSNVEYGGIAEGSFVNVEESVAPASG